MSEFTQLGGSVGAGIHQHLGSFGSLRFSAEHSSRPDEIGRGPDISFPLPGRDLVAQQAISSGVR